jgi:aspartate racemase
LRVGAFAGEVFLGTMNANGNKKTVGILGGMGPLSSAEFLKTIYEHSSAEREQEFPSVLMYSDPTFPDRTEAFLNGSTQVVLEQLIASLRSLLEAGVSSIVICCVTIHYLLPRLPAELRQPIVSLLDVIYEQLARTRKRHLLVCSNGTRQLNLLESHPGWESVKNCVVLPEEKDQHRIHYELIYPIKNNPNLSELMPTLESLLAKYKVDSFIAACTEVHLLAKHTNLNHRRYSCIDPLNILAKAIAEKRV